MSRQVPLGVLTNKPTAAAVRVLDGLGLAGFFREVVGGDGPDPRKPAPASLLALMAAAGAAASRLCWLAIPQRPANRPQRRDRFCYARYGFGSLQFPADETVDSDFVVDAAFDLSRVLHGARRCGLAG